MSWQNSRKEWRKKKWSFRNEDGLERAQRRMGIEKNTVTQRIKKRKAHKMKQK